MWGKVLEELTSDKLVKEVVAFYGTRMFSALLTNTR
jgi:hypothetical protein